MSFDSKWEDSYARGEHDSVWPWSDVVSFVKRYCEFKGKPKLLEIGLGKGANIGFLLSEGFDYFGIEGSRYAVDAVVKKYPQLADRILVGDFTKEPSICNKFDLILDRASMTHNDEHSVEVSFQSLTSSLNPGGLYIGVDWFSQEHSSFKVGSRVGTQTRDEIPDGPFAGIGKVLFSTETSIRNLVRKSGLDLIKLEHKITTDLNTQFRIGTFNFVAKKM